MVAVGPITLRSNPGERFLPGVHKSVLTDSGAIGVGARFRVGTDERGWVWMGRPRPQAERAIPTVAIPEMRWRFMRFMGVFFLVVGSMGTAQTFRGLPDPIDFNE